MQSEQFTTIFSIQRSDFIKLIKTNKSDFEKFNEIKECYIVY